jgi:hypothetical protein
VGRAGAVNTSAARLTDEAGRLSQQPGRPQGSTGPTRPREMPSAIQLWDRLADAAGGTGAAWQSVNAGPEWNS